MAWPVCRKKKKAGNNIAPSMYVYADMGKEKRKKEKKKKICTARSLVSKDALFRPKKDGAD